MDLTDKQLLALGASGAALAAAWFLRHRLSAARNVDDYQAAFPTAQWVAGMRAFDAVSDAPIIGSNIGAGPDKLARALTGDAGMDIFAASCKYYKCDGKALSQGLLARTLTYDKRWADALDAGCTQFVILAAGLDARAWRMPNMGAAVSVYEVDVPNAHAYKAARGAAAGAKVVPEPSCRRVAVEADLSEAGWPEKLKAAGFDPSKRSFFLMEGLLMYLPPGAPELLLQRVKGLMAPGSTLTGDAFVDCVASTDQGFMHQLGTKWTWDFASEAAAYKLFGETLGLKDVRVASVGVPGAPRGDGDKGEKDQATFVAAKATQLQAVMLGLGAWPAAALDLTLPGILLKPGDEGVKALVKQMVEDKMNFQGLKEAPLETKALIEAAILATPLDQAKHGTTDFAEALRATAQDVDKSREQRSRLRRWYDMAVFMRQMMKRAGTATADGYVTFVGTA